MPEDVSSRAWLRRARAQTCVAGCCGRNCSYRLLLRRVGPGKRAVLKVTLLLQCRVRGSVKLQPLRAGCPRASGSQRQPCGGCAQLSGVGKCRLTQYSLILDLTVADRVCSKEATAIAVPSRTTLCHSPRIWQKTFARSMKRLRHSLWRDDVPSWQAFASHRPVLHWTMKANLLHYTSLAICF